jgi:Superfamily II DNA/RNA helicases, SNF2 family
MKLKNTLLDHEVKAVEKLEKFKVGALFMEQGTGKTITALELCRKKLMKKIINRIIWLCPCSAKETVKEELRKQAPKEMLAYIIVCGIETLSTSVKANAYLRKLTETYRCAIIIDESLMIKNYFSKRTENIITLAEKCKYKLILNGTPISKDERDLFAQYYALDWRILGYKSYWSFSNNHIMYYDEVPDKVAKIVNTEYLVKRVEPYTFQITKKECFDLPSKRTITKWFYLTTEQELHYFAVANELFFAINEYQPETIYQFLSALQAILSGRRVIIHKEKGRRISYTTEPFFEKFKDNPRWCRFSEIIDINEKVVIFCRYTHEIDMLVSTLNEVYGSNSAVRYDGKITNKQRKKNRKKFMEEAMFFVANPKCAGYSLNLQFCSRIIYYSLDWDLGPRLQSEDRIYRWGQTKEVEIIDICAVDTLDEQIKNCLERKETLLEWMKTEIRAGKKAESLAINRNYKKMEGKFPIFDCTDLMEKNNAKKI